ncbi:MAG TPA: glycoside hydrolase family 3 protein, partial [Spirochaetes bacterium]|nr:glycoside hydrolase family 3 protein [Spirochaetota bacterium]
MIDKAETKKGNIASTVARLTLEQKASLCAGKNFWYTRNIDEQGIPSIMVADGPHGLRKQEANVDQLGISTSVPAVCFPTAATLASSWDRDLLHAVGTALGEECRAQKVSVLLGPGVNIKRSPLCGRNFEYYSEDPFLAGELAAAFINGVQSQGIGTSLKHYAVNNQEYHRLVSDSVVDERTLREIYLAAFETAVKKAKPWTVMAAYNRVNGAYCCEHRRLLTEILRDEWGFDG